MENTFFQVLVTASILLSGYLQRQENNRDIYYIDVIRGNYTPARSKFTKQTALLLSTSFSVVIHMKFET